MVIKIAVYINSRLSYTNCIVNMEENIRLSGCYLIDMEPHSSEFFSAVQFGAGVMVGICNALPTLHKLCDNRIGRENCLNRMQSKRPPQD